MRINQGIALVFVNPSKKENTAHIYEVMLMRLYRSVSTRPGLCNVTNNKQPRIKTGRADESKNKTLLFSES